MRWMNRTISLCPSQGFAREELMPSFYDSDSPDSEDDVNDFLPDFEFDTTESYIEFYDVGF